MWVAISPSQFPWYLLLDQEQLAFLITKLLFLRLPMVSVALVASVALAAIRVSVAILDLAELAVTVVLVGIVV